MDRLLGKPLAEKLLSKALELRSELGPIRLTCFLDPHSPESLDYLKQLKRVGETLKTDVVSFPIETETDVKRALALIKKPQPIGSFAALRPLSVKGVSALYELPFDRDPDCSSSLRKAQIYDGDPKAFLPATARAVMTLIDSTGINLTGRRALVVGRSPSVGLPVFHALMRRDCFASLAHSKVSIEDIRYRARESDVIVMASGVRGLISLDDLRSGQIIVDCGYSSADGMGDLGFVPPTEMPGFYTPVPGGVGPLTAISMFLNAYEMMRLI